jgi:PHD/YefM family antitoxin component YafN of YafNO toxin-antitoxin module
MLNVCLNYNEPINIATKKGNVVLMREEEYKGWKATLELCSVDGMKEEIIEGKNTPIEECEEVDIDAEKIKDISSLAKNATNLLKLIKNDP